MLHYTHGLSQAHNHRPCSSTSKPQVPKPTASRVTPQMSPHTLSPPLQGWGTTQASPAGIALIYTQQDAALCPVPPSPRSQAGVSLQSDLAGVSSRPWEGLPVPAMSTSAIPFPWPRAVRSSSRKRVKSQQLSSTAQHGSSRDRHCSKL